MGIGLQRRCLAKQRDRQRRLTPAKRHHATQIERVGIARIGFRRPDIGFFRRGKIAGTVTLQALFQQFAGAKLFITHGEKGRNVDNHEPDKPTTEAKAGRGILDA